MKISVLVPALNEAANIKVWKSERYWELMNLIASDKFDACTMCGTLCPQHKVNEFLWKLKEETEPLPAAPANVPPHVNFI